MMKVKTVPTIDRTLIKPGMTFVSSLTGNKIMLIKFCSIYFMVDLKRGTNHSRTYGSIDALLAKYKINENRNWNLVPEDEKKCTVALRTGYEFEESDIRHGAHFFVESRLGNNKEVHIAHKNGYYCLINDGFGIEAISTEAEDISDYMNNYFTLCADHPVDNSH